MRSPAREATPTPYPRVPLLFWPAAVVVALLVVGLVGPFRDEAQVLVPKEPLAAYRQIEAGDLEAKAVEEPGDVYAASSELTGALTLRKLPAGEPIGKDALVKTETDPGPVRLELQPDRATALGLEAGASVSLLLAPTGRVGEPVTVPGVLLAIPKAKEGVEQTYVVAFTDSAAQRLLGSLGRARLLITAS